MPPAWAPRPPRQEPSDFKLRQCQAVACPARHSPRYSGRILPYRKGLGHMGLVVAIQMDPIHSVNIDADSTFVLALEAQARGHALYHYLPRHLSLKDGRVTAKGQRLEVRREHGRHHTLGPLETIELAAVDVILMRQDPPFDMGYITATHILEHLKDTTLVVNDPVSVRNA